MCYFDNEKHHAGGKGCNRAANGCPRKHELVSKEDFLKMDRPGKGKGRSKSPWKKRVGAPAGEGRGTGRPKGDKSDVFNLGIYRMQVTGRDTTLMRWLKHRGGAQHYRRWKESKPEPLPAAVVLGADPGTILAAVTPVPDTLSEYQFAGLLRGRKVDLVDCKTVPLKVPAEAEIVLEGHVMLDEHGVA